MGAWSKHSMDQTFLNAQPWPGSGDRIRVGGRAGCVSYLFCLPLVEHMVKSIKSCHFSFHYFGIKLP